jgi:hypothetical protein
MTWSSTNQTLAGTPWVNIWHNLFFFPFYKKKVSVWSLVSCDQQMVQVQHTYTPLGNGTCCVSRTVIYSEPSGRGQCFSTYYSSLIVSCEGTYYMIYIYIYIAKLHGHCCLYVVILMFQNVNADVNLDGGKEPPKQLGRRHCVEEVSSMMVDMLTCIYAQYIHSYFGCNNF